jgi:serine/threonine protein kinase
MYFDNHRDKYEYITMEYLNGDDMSKLRDYNRTTIKVIPLPVVTYLTCQILECIKNLHQKGYVHR